MARAKHRDPVELPAHGSDDWVTVYPEPGLARDTARALLAAARDLGLDEQRAVLTSESGFLVPQQVLDAADLPTEASPDRDTHPTPLAALQQGALPDPITDPATDAPE